MRRFVGPALTDFLRPVFAAEIAPEERRDVPEFDRFKRARNVIDSGTRILSQRLIHQTVSDPDGNARVCQLIEERPNRFFYNTTDRVIKDGLISGIATPLVTATNIFRVENSLVPEYGHGSSTHFAAVQVNIPELINIINRGSFIDILGRLTKGPNGFLGSGSTAANAVWHDMFFDFIDPDVDPSSLRSLQIWDAFKMQDGKVVDLSGKYHRAAVLKRKKTAQLWAKDLEAMPKGDIDYEYNVSSGCPVRHKFEDSTGILQEPLIATSSRFLAALLQAAYDKYPPTSNNYNNLGEGIWP